MRDEDARTQSRTRGRRFHRHRRSEGAVRSAPTNEDVPPYLNFAPLDNGADALSPQRRRISQSLRARRRKRQHRARLRIAHRNQRAADRKRAQTYSPPKVCPVARGYKHQIYAPGVLHWLRSESHSSRPRSHRIKTVEASRRSHDRRRQSPPSRSRTNLLRRRKTLSGHNIALTTRQQSVCRSLATNCHSDRASDPFLRARFLRALRLA